MYILEGIEKKKDKTMTIQQILTYTEIKYEINTAFTRQAMRTSSRLGILTEAGQKLKEVYTLVIESMEEARKMIYETYVKKDQSELPVATKDYLKKYGFDALITDIANWTTYDGRVHKQYFIDRLWLMRYVDVLDIAREYLLWFKSDQAIARMRYKKATTKSDNDK